MNGPEEHGGNTDRPGKMSQTPWLQHAREQSRKRAEQKGALRPPALDWDVMEGAPRRGGALAARGLRLSWVAVLVLILVAGGTTGTWAYVRHKKQIEVKKRIEAERKELAQKLVEQEKRKLHALKAARKKVPAQAPVAEAAAPAPVKVAHKGKPKKPGKAAPAAAPEEKPAEKNGGEVIFDDPSMPGGGHVIIVRPPAKIGPLFEPEKYKNKGPGMSW